MRNVYIWNVSCTFSSLAPSRAYFLDAEVSLTSQCSRISAECVVGVSILRKLSACCGAVPFSGHLRDVVTLIYRSVPCPSPRPRTFAVASARSRTCPVGRRLLADKCVQRNESVACGRSTRRRIRSLGSSLPNIKSHYWRLLRAYLPCTQRTADRSRRDQSNGNGNYSTNNRIN